MMRRIDVVADWVILGLSDAVCQPVVLVPPLVAEELSLHCDAAEVTIVLVTSILAVVPFNKIRLDLRATNIVFFCFTWCMFHLN